MKSFLLGRHEVTAAEGEAKPEVMLGRYILHTLPCNDVTGADQPMRAVKWSAARFRSSNLSSCGTLGFDELNHIHGFPLDLSIDLVGCTNSLAQASQPQTM